MTSMETARYERWFTRINSFPTNNDGGIMKRFFSLVGFSVIVGLFCVLLVTSPAWASEPKVNLEVVLSKRVPVLLEFGRGWCKPCKYMKPILDDTAKLFNGKAVVLTVDMDVNKDLVRKFGIRVMPTQIFLQPDGKEFFRNEGTLEREQIAQVFAKMGAQASPRAGAGPGAVTQTAPR
jgi:thioredoxin 1